MRRASLASLLLAAVLLPAPVRAHQSFARFDTANPITLNGVVTAFEWPIRRYISSST